MNSIFYFEIHVDDLTRARAFYEAAFSWNFSRQEGLPIEYWRIETEGISGGILQRPVPTQSCGSNAFICSMEVENFDATAEAILANGGGVAMEKFAIPGRCWQGYFLDTENNTFGLFQPDENAK